MRCLIFAAMGTAAATTVLALTASCGTVPETTASAASAAPETGTGGVLHLRVAAAPLQRDVPRIGLNLGTPTYWGAEQLAANVLMNPGFEGHIDRALVQVAEVRGAIFHEARADLGRPDGFWRGAGYDVRTGGAAGQDGTLVDSRRQDRRGLPSFTVQPPPRGLAPGDIVALTQRDEVSAPAFWWVAEAQRPFVRPAADTRPGSPGGRSLRLQGRSSGVAVHSYLDSRGQMAGVLLPVEGDWRLGFWARAEGEATLHVRLARAGRPPFVDEEVALTTAWREVIVPFTTAADRAAGTLDLAFTVRGRGAVLLDDASLRSTADDGPWRRQVVETLQRLRPGYLRDWAGQLGDTVDNRLAPPFARRTTRYRPGGLGETLYSYGLPEFLALCEEVGARPWIVLPTTLSDAEAARLGVWLQTHAAGFDDVVVEFGNENWNPLFQAAGITDGDRHAAAAARALAALRAAAPDLSLHTVVNGQHVRPDESMRVLRAATSVDGVAVAPYLLHQLPAGLSPAAQRDLLFADDHAPIRRLHADGAEVSVYEVNLHTTGGDASAGERQALVAGAAAGSALAANLLRSWVAGVRRQCVYVLAGFEARLDDASGTVPLWGVVRDLTGPPRLRPTGLAMALLNEVAAGDLHVLTGDHGLLGCAFHAAGRWSAVLVNPSDILRRVALYLPDGGDRRRVRRLHATTPGATNESADSVLVVDADVEVVDGAVTFDLDPYGLVVVTATTLPNTDGANP